MVTPGKITADFFRDTLIKALKGFDAAALEIDIFVEEIEGHMSRRIGRGEGMAPVLEHRYGLNPAAGSYR